MNSIVSILMAEAAANFQKFVQPSLVAIYASHGSRPDTPVQVGAGFLLMHFSKAVLITARHVLRGNSFNEDPAEKAVHIDGRWVYIGSSKKHLIEPEDRDLAVTYMDEFPLSQCLVSSQWATTALPPKMITMGGFLARDFRRDGNTLRPAPRVYTNVAIPSAPGLVGLRYPKRRNIDTKTGIAAVSPTPSGFSGGPMVDTLELLKGAVVVAGVFTDMDNGHARGVNADIIRQSLALL